MSEQILNINQYDSNNQRHGYWEEYWTNGKISFRGYYINGKLYGYSEEYLSDSGKQLCAGCYVNDMPHGYWEWFNTVLLISKIYYL